MPRTTRLDYFKFGVRYELRPQQDPETGELVVDPETQEPVPVGIHVLLFTDTGPGAETVSVDLTEHARDTMMFLLSEEYLLNDAGEQAEDGEAELLRRIRTCREEILDYRQRQRAAAAGIDIASADMLPVGPPAAG